MRNLLIIVSLLVAVSAFAQSDSSSATKTSPRAYTHRDSVYIAKLNSNGNLMIAAGIGLCGAGSYLIYQGVKVYGTAASPLSANPAAEIDRNHRQGTIYLVAGGIAIAGGVILTAFGARNKVDFVRRKKMMSLQSGILDNGSLGVALNF